MSIRDEAERVLADADWQDRFARCELERLRLRDVAVIAGLSKGKVRDDAKRGNLRTVKVRAGTRWMFLVEREDARRYLADLFRAA